MKILNDQSVSGNNEIHIRDAQDVLCEYCNGRDGDDRGDGRDDHDVRNDRGGRDGHSGGHDRTRNHDGHTNVRNHGDVRNRDAVRNGLHGGHHSGPTHGHKGDHILSSGTPTQSTRRQSISSENE